MQDPLAYFITFHTYGTWLHGREDGSVDDEHKTYGQAFAKPDANRHTVRESQMNHPEISLDGVARQIVLDSLLETCQYRQWSPNALHVRSNHVHCVISAANVAPEKVLNDLKAYATRNLRRKKAFAAQTSIWSRHGSTRYLWDESSVYEKCHYTLEEQGEPMACWPSSELEA